MKDAARHSPTPPHRGSGGSREAVLRISDAAVVLSAPGALHVFTPSRATLLRGGHLDRLHDRLAPFLSGQHTEDALLGRIPQAQQSAVRSYLDGLRRAGALDSADVVANDDDPISELGPERPRASFRAGGMKVEVRLDGPLPMAPAGGLHLCFASSAEGARLLSEAGRGAWEGRMVLVVADAPGEMDGAELSRRAVFAYWLLRTAAAGGNAVDALTIFRLGASGELARVAVLGRSAMSRRTLAAQTRALRWAELPQAPLVVARAGMPLAPDAGVRGIGVSARRAWPRMLREWAARMLLDMGDGALAHGTARAHTALELRLELAARWLDERDGGVQPEWHPVDLLREHADGAAAYLQDVLRLRMRRLEGARAVTSAGVHHVRGGGHSARSLSAPAALGSVLAAAVWDEFYPGEATPAMAYGPLDFAPCSALKHLLLNADAPRGRVTRLRVWGVPVWAGALEDAGT